MAYRFNVKTDDVPEQMKIRGFVAYITDDEHPDDPKGGPLSCSWHQSAEDARRICHALNFHDEVSLMI